MSQRANLCARHDPTSKTPRRRAQPNLRASCPRGGKGCGRLRTPPRSADRPAPSRTAPSPGSVRRPRIPAAAHPDRRRRPTPRPPCPSTAPARRAAGSDRSSRAARAREEGVGQREAPGCPPAGSAVPGLGFRSLSGRGVVHSAGSRAFGRDRIIPRVYRARTTSDPHHTPCVAPFTAREPLASSERGRKPAQTLGISPQPQANSAEIRIFLPPEAACASFFGGGICR